MPPDIQAIYDECLRIEAERIPYVDGGGHNPDFELSIGLTKGPTKGLDCSAVLSKAVHAGDPKEMPGPLATEELERWGLAGLGEWITIRVIDAYINGVYTEHCFIEFRKGVPSEHRYFMAHHTNGPSAGFVAEGDFNPAPYTARRKEVR